MKDLFISRAMIDLEEFCLVEWITNSEFLSRLPGEPGSQVLLPPFGGR